MEDCDFMRRALELAEEAAQAGEVPVGCVVTLGDRIVGEGRNRRETAKNALCHAELEARRKESRRSHHRNIHDI